MRIESCLLGMIIAPIYRNGRYLLEQPHANSELARTGKSYKMDKTDLSSVRRRIFVDGLVYHCHSRYRWIRNIDSAPDGPIYLRLHERPTG